MSKLQPLKSEVLYDAYFFVKSNEFTEVPHLVAYWTTIGYRTVELEGIIVNMRSVTNIYRVDHEVVL